MTCFGTAISSALRPSGRREARNFYWSFRLLPPERRRSMCALYAFLRQSDDLADEPGEPAAKGCAIERWRQRLESAPWRANPRRRPRRCPRSPIRCAGTRFPSSICTTCSTAASWILNPGLIRHLRSCIRTAIAWRQPLASAACTSGDTGQRTARPSAWRKPLDWRFSSRTFCATCVKTPAAAGSTFPGKISTGLE